MTRYYATGKFTPAETGILVWRDFIVPLVSTAITTIWAFVPLLLAGGIIGEPTFRSLYLTHYGEG